MNGISQFVWLLLQKFQVIFFVLDLQSEVLSTILSRFRPFGEMRTGSDKKKKTLFSQIIWNPSPSLSFKKYEGRKHHRSHGQHPFFWEIKNIIYSKPKKLPNPNPKTHLWHVKTEINKVKKWMESVEGVERKLRKRLLPMAVSWVCNPLPTVEWLESCIVQDGPCATSHSEAWGATEDDDGVQVIFTERLPSLQICGDK